MIKKYIFILLGFIFLIAGCRHDTDTYGPSLVDFLSGGGDIGQSTEKNISTWIDDFEDGNFTDMLGGTWKTEFDGDGSTGNISMTNGYGGSVNALKFGYCLDSTLSYRYSMVKDTFPVQDFSDDTGIHFWLKGDGHNFRFMVYSTNMGTEWNWPGYNINPTPTEWTEYYIPFSDLSKDLTLILTAVEKIQFKANSTISNESGWICIDDVYTYK